MGSMPPKQPPIAVLGAGPAGLSFARILEVNKINYTIFERDPSADYISPLGGTLDIHDDSGQLALKAGGLLDKFRSIARYDAQYLHMCDKEGNVHLKLGEDAGEARPEIDRKDLRKLLLDSIPAERLQWGSKIQKVQREDDGTMSIECADGNVSAGFRLVVGADGAWSKARSLVTDVKPTYRGRYYFTSWITKNNPYQAKIAAVVGPGNWLAFGERKMITIQGLADGHYTVNVGMLMEEDWPAKNQNLVKDPEVFRKYLIEDQLANFSDFVKDAFRYSEGDFRPWPQYALPPESISWEHVPGVALIGDAAHINVIDGEGVNRAMFDGWQLAQQIVDHGIEKLDEAVIEYEKEMQPRARESLAEGQQSTEAFFDERAPHNVVKAFTETGQI